MGKYFKIEELISSNTAKSRNINNTPNSEELKNLENLIITLDIIRESWGKPIKVNSGYRCDALNKAVGGSKTSWHVKGYAADITSSDNKKLLEVIIDLFKHGKIKFTELINEKPDKNGNPNWIHIAVNPNNLKNQIKLIK